MEHLAHSLDAIAGPPRNILTRECGQTLLLVEDERRLRRLLGRILRQEGYQVLQAGSGLEALRVASTMDHIDLLITDLIMPEPNGRVVAQTLRRDRPDLRVLYISGYAHPPRSDAPPELDSWLQKPFEADTLCAQVRAALLNSPVTE